MIALPPRPTHGPRARGDSSLRGNAVRSQDRRGFPLYPRTALDRSAGKSRFTLSPRSISEYRRCLAVFPESLRAIHDVHGLVFTKCFLFVWPRNPLRRFECHIGNYWKARLACRGEGNRCPKGPARTHRVVRPILPLRKLQCFDLTNKNLANSIPRASNICFFSRLEGRERSTISWSLGGDHERIHTKGERQNPSGRWRS